MGDRVQMEIKRKKREVTLAGLFTRYTVIFCVNILLIFVILIGVICLFPLSSLFLPANYAEEQIDEKRDAIAEADVVTSDLIPNRCSYGVYDADGICMEILRMRKKSRRGSITRRRSHRRAELSIISISGGRAGRSAL